MTDPPWAGQDEPEFMASLRREFAKTLPERIGNLQGGLRQFEDDPAPHSVERLFYAAHSLKGSAPGFGAHSCVEHATELTEMARGWLRGYPVNEGQIERAHALVLRLEEEAARYLAWVSSADGADSDGQ